MGLARFSAIRLDWERITWIRRDLLGLPGLDPPIHPSSSPKRSGSRAIVPFRLRFIIFKGPTYSYLLLLWWQKAEGRKIGLNNSPIEPPEPKKTFNIQLTTFNSQGASGRSRLGVEC
jgi:hypothetical protein